MYAPENNKSTIDVIFTKIIQKVNASFKQNKEQQQFLLTN